MAIDAADLQREVGTNVAEDPAIDSAVETAHELLLAFIEDQGAEVPDVIFDRAWLAVAVDLFNQSKAPNGVLNQQFNTGDGVVAAPVRISADPLRPAYPLLRMWILPVI